MSEKGKSTFNMPMAELVIIVGIFAVISVFLMRLYMSADSLQSSAVDISRATIIAQTAAEELKNGTREGMIGDAAEMLGYTQEGDVFVTEMNGYKITLKFEEQIFDAGILCKGELSVYSGDEELISIPVYTYN